MGKEGPKSTKTHIVAKARCVNGIVFDAGGLIALERDNRHVATIVQTARRAGIPILVPATALAQALRNPARQVRLWRTLHFEETQVIPLDKLSARTVGELLARTRTSDITDAHVVICAQQADYTVITSDPSDIERLDPALAVIPV